MVYRNPGNGANDGIAGVYHSLPGPQRLARGGTFGAMQPVVCCDLDGVVWRGDDPIDGSADAVARLRSAGLRVVFVTNNSNATRATYVAKLARHGVPTVDADLLTSAGAAAELLADRLDRGAAVLVCGGPGLREACAERALTVVDDGPAAAVVVGWHREFDFERLRVAADAVRNGAWFVATNDDPTYPGAGGTVLPGNGSIVAAVATASGQRPVVAGKPNEAMVALVRRHCGDHGIMIGDRVSTDGAFAAALGWPFGLVRSGIAGSVGGEAVPDHGTQWVADDLAALVGAILESPQVRAVS